MNASRRGRVSQRLSCLHGDTDGSLEFEINSAYICSSTSTVSRTSRWAAGACATVTLTCATSTTSALTRRSWCASASTTRAATSVRSAVPASWPNRGDRRRPTAPTSAKVSALAGQLRLVLVYMYRFMRCRFCFSVVFVELETITVALCCRPVNRML